MFFHGLSSGHLYFADAFQKYGIEVQVSRVGKFKSAVEPYILDKMSPESREQTKLSWATSGDRSPVRSRKPAI